jgi:hypothetical protein
MTCALSTLMAVGAVAFVVTMCLGALAFVVYVAWKLWRAAFPRGMATYRRM